MPTNREAWDNAGKNVVVLHMMDRGNNCPNPSPYPLKFETYLRIAGIKYVTDFTKPMSPDKNKTPWMTFNGRDMGDSQLCIEHLIEEMPDKDISAYLSPAEKATARGMRALFEDHFYFVLVLNRWCYGSLVYLREEVFGPTLPVPNFLRGLLMNVIKKKVIKQTDGQGMGRHSKEDVLAMGVKALKTASDFLGDKPFMMGEKPSEVDCVLFGFLVCMLYGTPEGHILRTTAEGCPNLVGHTQRIKENYWPDWDECVYKKQ